MESRKHRNLFKNTPTYSFRSDSPPSFLGNPSIHRRRHDIEHRVSMSSSSIPAQIKGGREGTQVRHPFCPESNRMRTGEYSVRIGIHSSSSDGSWVSFWWR